MYVRNPGNGYSSALPWGGSMTRKWRTHSRVELFTRKFVVWLAGYLVTMEDGGNTSSHAERRNQKDRIRIIAIRTEVAPLEKAALHAAVRETCVGLGRGDGCRR